MARGLVIGRRRVRLRFIFFLAAIVVCILRISNVWIGERSYGTVEYGSITIWNHGDGLIIRDEETFSANSYGKIEYFSADGEMVEKDELLAVLYKSNYKEDLIDDLYEVKQKIANYQKKNIVQDVLDNDYNSLESSINKVVQNIQFLVYDSSLNKLEYQEKQLRTLLARRQEFLNKKITPDQYLQKLYEEETKLNQQIAEWKIDIVAPDSGIISFQLDGLEGILNIGSLDYMTIEEFLAISKTLSTQDMQAEQEPEEELEQPLFRLINPSKWYLVCHIPTTDIFYEKNDVLKVKLLGSTEEVLEGVVYKIDRGNDSALIILELTEGIDSIIYTRDLPIEIGKTTEGLLVPSSCIIKKNGKTGVEFVYKGQICFVEVKVKAMNEEKAVIEKIGDVEGLNIHDKVVMH